MAKVPQLLVAGEPADLRDWRDETVGWGLILPENESISPAERAAGVDAPKPIRDLLASRPGSPVFRYRPHLGSNYLRRYYDNGRCQDTTPSESRRGVGRGNLPRYLLIYGSPKEIPWDLQYVLNVSCFVGRLDLDGQALENYVSALIDNWKDASCDPHKPVVWAVDHGQDDITWLMRHAIAEPVRKKLAADSDIGDSVRHLAGTEATASALITSLAEASPALVITTSHGMTGPLDDALKMAADLGVPVDDLGDMLRPDELLTKWQPNGAIWYAHACCSAGSDGSTKFAGLVKPGSMIDSTLKAVAGLGAQIAPLPQALLGAKRPLRAFVGHVEPTFDWTIRHPDTGQVLTSDIQAALYNRMHRKQPEPVGMAFQDYFHAAGSLANQWLKETRNVRAPDPDARQAAREVALRLQLAALDRQSTVILGDPTATMPSLT
jgi:hypothetical protein